MFFIPLINPQSFILRKQLNVLFFQDPFIPKILMHAWKNVLYDTQKKNDDCILCYIPNHQQKKNSKRFLLLWFSKQMKSYLYSPETGTFYCFIELSFPIEVCSGVFDVEIISFGFQKGIIYLRDVYYFGGVCIADMPFLDRKQINDIVSLHLNPKYTSTTSWTFSPCNYIYKTQEMETLQSTNTFFMLYENMFLKNILFKKESTL